MSIVIEAGFPGGDFPIFGSFKLRNLNAILAFLADTIDKTPEFEVAPDPRMGPLKENPIRTMDIQLTDSAPNTDLRIKFAGKYYSIPNTNWDREAFIRIRKPGSLGQVRENWLCRKSRPWNDGKLECWNAGFG
jgi:hypothetical protein